MSREDTSEIELSGAIGSVLDPEIRLPLADLGMLRWVKRRRSRLDVQLTIPAPEHPAQQELDNRIRQAAHDAGFSGEVNVRTDVMDSSERDALRNRLKSSDDNGHGTPSAPSTPFNGRSSRTRVIGVSSGKGGVGKSSVTVNLALGLTAIGKTVSVLDADVYGFSVPKMLGIDHDPMVVVDVMVPPVAYGIACLSMGLFVEDAQPLIWRGPMLHKALQQFLTDAFWGEPDFLLIDMPPGTGDIQMGLSRLLPSAQVMVVTTPHDNSAEVASRMADMARKGNLALAGLVENMSYFVCEHGSKHYLFGRGAARALAEQTGLELLASIPLVSHDTDMPATIQERFLSQHADVAAFRELAEVVTTRVAPPVSMGSCTSRIMALAQDLERRDKLANS